VSVFELQAFDNHEKVVFCSDVESGLKAIVCIHNTKLGPAVGGCRMWEYRSDKHALVDALRLSRGMSYKNAMAGLNMGGGKSVIIGNAKTLKSTQLLRAFGRFIETLNGVYITGEDVGITPGDMEVVHQETNHVLGLEGKSGDPSPVTAYGVFTGMKAAVKHRLNRDSLEGVRVAVQGAGHVGYYLCKLLHEEGAHILISDINEDSVLRFEENFNATSVAVDQIYRQDVDVFAPCALGGILNDETIPHIKASVIAGAANNQLADEQQGNTLKRRGILYAPDYVINAGGVINASFENDYDQQLAYRKVETIYENLSLIFECSDRENCSTNQLADNLAREIIAESSGAR